MANVIPKQVKKEIVDDWLLETWKVCLLTSAFVYNHSTDDTYSDISDNEVSGTGYTAGGATISRLPWDSGSGYVDTHDANIDANDVTWTNATFTARYAAVYETTGGKIRAIYDFGSNVAVAGSSFRITWNSGGMIKITS